MPAIIFTCRLHVNMGAFDVVVVVVVFLGGGLFWLVGLVVVVVVVVVVVFSFLFVCFCFVSWFWFIHSSSLSSVSHTRTTMKFCDPNEQCKCQILLFSSIIVLVLQTYPTCPPTIDMCAYSFLSCDV